MDPDPARGGGQGVMLKRRLASAMDPSTVRSAPILHGFEYPTIPQPLHSIIEFHLFSVSTAIPAFNSIKVSSQHDVACGEWEREIKVLTMKPL